MKNRLQSAFAISLLALATAAQAGDSPDASERCKELGKLSNEQLEIEIAALVPDKATVPGAHLPRMDGTPGKGPQIEGLPAFCRVAGRLHPVPGSNIGFEVWMPAEGWDGRFHGVGVGAFAGSIDYLTLGGVIRAGQAGAATDTGHSASPHESDWARGNPEAIRDHGWRAVHEMTVTAKSLITAFYGKGPQYSYFVGCSGGGRQGLIEASRYPEDYDGILSGAPAAVWTDMALSMINTIQAQDQEGSSIRGEQAALLESEVLRQCDTVDGQQDQLVADPRQCTFDPSPLSCDRSNSDLCFTSAQLTALEKIIAGPRASNDAILANGYLPVGSEVGTPLPTLGWETYILGGAPAAHILAGGLLKNFVAEPFATPENFDFDTDTARIKAAVGADLDTEPDLSSYFERGGKLILWHGWADAAIPPGATLDFHAEVLRRSGPEAAGSTQLFMAPGVQHCLGGRGPGSFGQLGAPPPGATPDDNLVVALQAWVEDGKKPEHVNAGYGLAGLMGIPARKEGPTRKICAEPLQTVLLPGQDPDTASSYTCKRQSEAR